MFPMNLGYTGRGNGIFPAGYFLTNSGYYDDDLPEEVREMIEDSRDSIESEADIRSLAEEAYYRR